MLDGGSSAALAPTRPHSRMSSPDLPFKRVSLPEANEPMQACISIGRDCNSVALSPNGNHVVVGLQDHTLQIWEVVTQVQLHILRGHKYWVNHVVYSPDGLRIASASADKTVKVWFATSGECELTLQGHLLSVASVAFSPDCTQLASASWDKTVCIWDVQLGRVLQTLQGHTDWVHGVSWSPGSWQIASASSDHSVRVWSSASGLVEHVLVGHLQTVTCVSFASSSILASGSLDRTVRVWNAQEGNFIARLMQESDEGSVNCVSFTADADRIVIGCSGKCVKVWNFRSGDVEARFVGHEDAVMGVCASADVQKLFSCGLDKTLRMWKMPTRSIASALPPSMFRSNGVSTNQSAAGGRRVTMTSRLQEAIQVPPKELLSDDAVRSKALDPNRREDVLEMKEKLERSFEEMRRELRQLPTSPAGTLPHEQSQQNGTLPQELRHLPVTPAGSGLAPPSGGVNGASRPQLPVATSYTVRQPVSTDRNALAAMQLGLAGSAAVRPAVAYSPPPISFQSLLMPAGLAGLGAAGSGVQQLEGNRQHATLSRSTQSQRQVSPVTFSRLPTSLAGSSLGPTRAISGSMQARSPRRSSAEARSLSPVSPVWSMPGSQYPVGRTVVTTRPAYQFSEW